MAIPIGEDRLYTKREIKRAQQNQTDKQLIKLHRRRMQIRHEDKELGYEELKPPIQKGWKRLFVLTETSAKHPDAILWQSLLDKINTVQYSDRKDFKEKKRRKGKKVYLMRLQSLEVLWPWSYVKLIKSEKEQSYFNEVPVYRIKHIPEVEYVFNRPWLFELKVFPNMITRVKIIDPLLEKENDEIKEYLVSRNLEDRMRRLVHGRSYNKNWACIEKAKYLSWFKTESIQKLLAEYY